jgi:hypothetical protein
MPKRVKLFVYTYLSDKVNYNLGEFGCCQSVVVTGKLIYLGDTRAVEVRHCAY